MKWFKMASSLLLLAVCGLCLGGCRPAPHEAGQTGREEVHIPVTFIVDPNTGNRENEALVEAFNEQYQGIYYVDVTWIMETEEEYRQNLKRLNVTDNLPAVITDLRMLPSLYRTMIDDRRIVDLKPYLEADPEWLAAIEEDTLAACTEADGRIYLLNEGTSVFTCSGMFWNEELFRQAGITEFPATWEAFWQVCEQLESNGITPLALHTEGTAWAPMLIATAEAAGTQSGYEFMQTSLPDTYQNATGEQIAETLTHLFDYTTDNALHSDFDAAYLNFFSGNTAMIPNGYWMLADIPEEWRDKVRFSAFPEGTLISSPETFGWAVTSSSTAQVQAGAVEFLKFRTLQGIHSKEEYLSRDRMMMSEAEAGYIDAFLRKSRIVPNYQVKWNSILQEQTLGTYLPLLVNGEISTADFLQAADLSIAEYDRER